VRGEVAAGPGVARSGVHEGKDVMAAVGAARYALESLEPSGSVLLAEPFDEEALKAPAAGMLPGS
jgi:hypothetical protein